MQSFFRCPQKRFDGSAWTITVGFRTVAGPFRFGDDADYLIAQLAAQAAPVRRLPVVGGRKAQAA